MPTQPLPFASLDLSADKPTTSTFNQGQIDGFWTPYGSPDGPKLIWQKRPGLSQFCNLGENGPVDGQHFWVRNSVLYAACNAKMFRLTSAGVATDRTGTASMVAQTRPTFADVAGTDLYAASGGRIGAYPLGGSGAYLADAQAPTTVRFIATLNQVLMGLTVSSSRVDYADATTPAVWAGLYFEAEAQPDLVQCLHVANNYIYLPGQNTIELWRDDGETFVREGQGAVMVGTQAPDSFIFINGTAYWLDETGEFRRMSGYTPEIISNPNLTRYVASFDTTIDAKADYLRIQDKHFAVWTFTVAQKTLVYDILLNQWYEWSYYNPNTAQHEQYLGQNVAHATAWNKVLVGDRRTGIIWEVTGTTDNGDDIRTVIRTDAVDRGSPDVRKFCHELNLVFKRADTATTPKKMLIRWRDNGVAEWGAYEEVAIEATSQTELSVQVRRLGSYFSRQWELVMSDATQSALIKAEERFTYGR